MKPSSARVSLLVGVVVALIFSACSAASTPAPQATDKTIYFGSGATPGSPEAYLLPLFTAGRANLKTAGYDLQYTSLSNDEVVSASIDRGRIDVALQSMVGLQRAAKAGLKMKWILTNETQNTFVLVVKKDVTDLKQLKGKKIGSQDATSLATAAIPGIFGAAGLQPADYSVVYLAGSAARAAALEAGSMDASMMLYSIATQLGKKTNGAWKVWGGGATGAPAAMWEGFVASESFRSNKTAATAFVKAMLAAWKDFYAADATKLAKDAIALELNELQGFEEETGAADLKLYQTMKLFPTDGGLSQDLFTRMMDTLVAVNQLKKEDIVPYASAVDDTFLKEATK